MNYTILLSLSLIFVIGCSDKRTHLQKREIQYQQFLNQQSDKKLEQEMEHYEN